MSSLNLRALNQTVNKEITVHVMEKGQEIWLSITEINTGKHVHAFCKQIDFVKMFAYHG